MAAPQVECNEIVVVFDTLGTIKVFGTDPKTVIYLVDENSALVPPSMDGEIVTKADIERVRFLSGEYVTKAIAEGKLQLLEQKYGYHSSVFDDDDLFSNAGGETPSAAE